MASPGSFAAGGVLTAAEMNALPGGIVALQKLGGASPTTTTLSTVNQFLLGASDLDVVAGRTYVLTLFFPVINNASTSLDVRARINVFGGRVNIGYATLLVGDETSLSATHIFTAGSTLTGQNYSIEIDTNTGTCDIITQDDGTEAIFAITDVGVL